MIGEMPRKVPVKCAIDRLATVRLKMTARTWKCESTAEMSTITAGLVCPAHVRAAVYALRHSTIVGDVDVPMGELLVVGVPRKFPSTARRFVMLTLHLPVRSCLIASRAEPESHHKSDIFVLVVQLALTNCLACTRYRGSFPLQVPALSG